MKKIFLSFIVLLFGFGAFALDSQIDVLAGGFYNYTNIFKGSATYQKVVNYDYQTYNGDYRAAFNAAGGSLGFDLFFNNFPLGVYFRAGLMGVSGVERTAGGKNVKLDNTEITYNMFYDVGGTYAFDINKYFSFCAAPAISFLFVDSQYRDFSNLYSSRATEDSLFGLGVTADLYAKFRYKYFVASAGCAASIYPLTLVTSADSSINYSTNIRNTAAYNLRPYISIGFTFKEHTASTISAAN